MTRKEIAEGKDGHRRFPKRVVLARNNWKLCDNFEYILSLRLAINPGH